MKSTETGARPLARTIPATQQMLSLSRASVYRLIAAGKLDARKLSGRTVIMDGSIQCLLDNAPRAQIGGAA